MTLARDNGAASGDRSCRPRGGALQRDACRTRLRLSAAAVHLFSKRAYGDVGVREIAERAGVDAALVSRYFGSKRELFVAALQSACAAAPWSGQNAEGACLPDHLLNIVGGVGDNSALSMVLHSLDHPDTSSLVRAAIAKHIIEPLAAQLHGPRNVERAELLCSLAIGTTLLFQCRREKPPHQNPVLADAVRRIIEDT